jgi:hypothetical protein
MTMAEKETIILPPKYYLDYFNYLLRFVETYSPHLLGTIGTQFISGFRALSEDAQCLMLRMANRKGEYYRLAKFDYAEIENIDLAAEALVSTTFASFQPPHDPRLFGLYTKNELCDFFPHLIEKGMKKEEVLFILETEAETIDYEDLLQKETVLHFTRQDEFEFMKLLFFGHRHGQMTEFVIRDVGHVKLENLEGHSFTPWFDSHEEALAVFELSKLDHAIRDFMLMGTPQGLLEVISPINWSRLIDFAHARKAADKLMLNLGEYFERQQFWDEALSYYALAKKHPARERQIRIYDKTDRKEDARDLAAYVYDAPYNASEKIFAQDYLAKSGARTNKSTTDRIKLGMEITVTPLPYTKVENLALEHFFEQGYSGVHAENHLWRGIFGLLFWDELFSTTSTSFHHPLQRAPSDLRTSEFYDAHKDLLSRKLDSLRSKKEMIAAITTTHNLKDGLSNHLVGWHPDLLPTVAAAVQLLPLNGLKKILLEMAKNVKDNSTGFPDLFVWKGKEYHFYEIKSPNDHLSAQQLFWLDFFANCGIKSEILRLKWG